MNDSNDIMPVYDKYKKPKKPAGDGKFVSFKCPVEWTKALQAAGINQSKVCRDAIEKIYLALVADGEAKAPKTTKRR